jgi:hypothetical protein
MNYYLISFKQSKLSERNGDEVFVSIRYKRLVKAPDYNGAKNTILKHFPEAFGFKNLTLEFL